MKVVRRRDGVMHADARKVFVYGFIFKLRAVIRQKYLGGAKS